MAEKELMGEAKRHEGQRIDTILTHAGLSPQAFHGFVNPPVVRGSTVLFENVDAMHGRAGRPLFLRTDEYADHRGAGGSAEHPRRRGRNRARALGPCRRHHGDPRRSAAGQEDPGPRQRLCADAALLRRKPQRLRRGDDLLRPVDRLGNRRHARRRCRAFPGGARLAHLRDAGHSGHGRAGASGGRHHDARQHLGDAADLPAARSRDRPRNLRRRRNTRAAIPTSCSVRSPPTSAPGRRCAGCTRISASRPARRKSG